MNAGIVIAICTVLIGAVPIYYLAKSNARENERQKREAIDKAVTDATQPWRDENSELKQKLVRREARITELEDKLYGRRP